MEGRIDFGERSMKTEILTVPDISCYHCKAAIEGALKKVAGVEATEVDVAGMKVHVTYDEAKVGREKIIAAIEEQGYTVKG